MKPKQMQQVTVQLRDTMKETNLLKTFYKHLLLFEVFFRLLNFVGWIYAFVFPALLLTSVLSTLQLRSTNNYNKY